MPRSTNKKPVYHFLLPSDCFRTGSVEGGIEYSQMMIHAIGDHKFRYNDQVQRPHEMKWRKATTNKYVLPYDYPDKTFYIRLLGWLPLHSFYVYTELLYRTQAYQTLKNQITHSHRVLLPAKPAAMLLDQRPYDDIVDNIVPMQQWISRLLAEYLAQATGLPESDIHIKLPLV